MFVILDRDGVINEDSDQYIKSVDEWIPIEGSLEAIGQLSAAGVGVAVATNQSGLARGFFKRVHLEAMHHKMTTLLKAHGGQIEHIAFCPHMPDENCICRKPKPGMLDEISELCEVELGPRVDMVGDSIKDLEVAVARNVNPVLVLTGKGKGSLEKLPAHPDERVRQAQVFDNLAAYVASKLS